MDTLSRSGIKNKIHSDIKLPASNAYTRFELGCKYFNYYLHGDSSKGHGVHSPFIFSFIRDVLNDEMPGDRDPEIEAIRVSLLRNDLMIRVDDQGAGSSTLHNKERSVSSIAASSLKPKKYARLLNRIIRYYRRSHILELGTSFGITTAYLATANNNARVYTLEGSSAIADIAKEGFRKLGISNINLIKGNFDDLLPGVLYDLGKVDFAFIDGNHRKVPTLDYFNQILQFATPTSIIVLDDIHWSRDMEEAWMAIRANPGVLMTVDLFFLGIVFMNPQFMTKQHFSIRF